MSSGEDIFEGMKRTKSGWGEDDLHTLYTGYGFTCREGKKHRLYVHPTYKDLRATVGRHKELATGYAQHAVKTIGKLLEYLKGEKNDR